MTDIDQIKAVIRMQDYIHQRIGQELTIDEISAVSGYSKRHSLRIFKEHLDKTVFEYIRDLRVTMAACRLIGHGKDHQILDVALDLGYNSHDGFTKAFSRYYGIVPKDYRKGNLPDGYTKRMPMSYYYLLLRSKGMNSMSQTRTVTATVITKPKRKLILKRGIKAADYFAYCDEVGCDIWDELKEIPDRLDTVALVILPDFLVKPNTSKACCAVEVPLDYNAPIPEGCDIIELSEHTMLAFQGAPYEDEDWYGGAHSEVASAVANYNPALYGYSFAYDTAPEFHYGTSAKDGCRQLVPIKQV